MADARLLVVTADDFGIGPETSRGILDLADQGVVTSTVLLVNSPYAAESIATWRDRGARLEMGWHPCLTLDRPLAPPESIPSLVNESGEFYPLGQVLKRLLQGQIPQAEIATEYRAQMKRYQELIGSLPPAVNHHHHLHIFGPCARALHEVLSEAGCQPYIRRVIERPGTLFRIPGARSKRVLLTRFGARTARVHARSGYPGNDELLGITDPPFVNDPAFFERWLRRSSGKQVELACHPGYLDATIEGRDGSLADGQLHRRAAERTLLSGPEFRQAVAAAGFRLVSATEMSFAQNRSPLPGPAAL